MLGTRAQLVDQTHQQCVIGPLPHSSRYSSRGGVRGARQSLVAKKDSVGVGQETESRAYVGGSGDGVSVLRGAGAGGVDLVEAGEEGVEVWDVAAGGCGG